MYLLKNLHRYPTTVPGSSLKRGEALSSKSINFTSVGGMYWQPTEDACAFGEH